MSGRRERDSSDPPPPPGRARRRSSSFPPVSLGLADDVTQALLGRGAGGISILALLWAFTGNMVLGWAGWMAWLTSVGYWFAMFIVWAVLCDVSGKRKQLSQGKLPTRAGAWMGLAGAQALAAFWFSESQLFAGVLGGAALLWTAFMARPLAVREIAEAGISDGAELEAYELASGLPESLRAPLAQLGGRLPQDLQRSLENGLEDYLHLKEVLAETSESSLDATQMLTDAAATLESLVRQVKLTDKLQSLASRREDDDQARSAVETARQKLEALGQALHDTTGAAMRFAASEASEDAAQLRARAEHLHLLAEAREELEAELE